MTRDELEDALDTVEEALTRAKAVVSGAPYWTFVSEPEWARLDTEDDHAVLYLCSATTEWDSSVLETERVTFPIALLFISDAELAQWKAEQLALYEKEQRARKAAELAERERQERADYAALKAKFGE